MLAAAGDGDSVKLVPVAKARAAADGTFVLRIDPNAPIDQFMANDGLVNFDVISYGADGARQVLAVPRWFNADNRTWHPTAERNTAVVATTFEAAAVLGGLEAEAPAALDKSCTSTVVATYNTRLGLVGEVYSGPNATADLEYINGSSSTLGVGFSASGTYGSYSASGTAGQNSTWTENYPLQAQNKRTVMQTNFGYKKYKNTCYSPGGYYEVTYTVRPYQFQGGQSTYTAASSPSATYCVSYVKGGSTTKDTGTALTFTNGLKLGSVIGIDLSIKTGFNANTKLKFNWVNAGQLCGSNGYPPQAARVVGK